MIAPVMNKDVGRRRTLTLSESTIAEALNALSMQRWNHQQTADLVLNPEQKAEFKGYAAAAYRAYQEIILAQAGAPATPADYVPGDRLAKRALGIVDRLVCQGREQFGADLGGRSIEDLLIENIPELTRARARELADEYRDAFADPGVVR